MMIIVSGLCQRQFHCTCNSLWLCVSSCIWLAHRIACSNPGWSAVHVWTFVNTIRVFRMRLKTKVQCVCACRTLFTHYKEPDADHHQGVSVGCRNITNMHIPQSRNCDYHTLKCGKKWSHRKISGSKVIPLSCGWETKK